MQTFNNVHQQFAEFFKSEAIKPFAYLVSKKLAEGHICLELDHVQEELSDVGFPDRYKALKGLAVLVKEPLVSFKGGPTQPFVLHNKKLYFHRYFNYEGLILKRLKEFVTSEARIAEGRHALITEHGDFIKALFNKDAEQKPDVLTVGVDWQLVAAVFAVLNNFTIITGGPGTGKTTTVAKILAILYTVNPNLKVALATPTGKAAGRMAESLKSASLNVSELVKSKFETIIPGTIHRLLKSNPDTPYFKHNKENPVNYNVVVVDEFSMIDVALFAKLLDAIGPETKLILLGDKDQLASVEAGSLFGDLCKAQQGFQISKERATLINNLIPKKENQIFDNLIADNLDRLLFEHIVELRTSHRFNSNMGIGKFSKAVIESDEQQLTDFLKIQTDEQVIIDTNYDEKIFESCILGFLEYIKETGIKEALRKLNKFRVLCAIREGEQGLKAVNRKIEKFLHQKKAIMPTTEFYENRPIIVTKNYYDLNLFNGDVGILRYDEKKVLKAWFEDSSGELKPVLPGFISEVETVFAMTIHKSQGSEYNEVLLILPDAADIALLTAELLYTGVTRARSKVVIQATEEVILETSKRRVKRASGIIERLEEQTQ